MTDAHFHRNGFDTFLVTNGHEVAFHGLHPWQSAACADIPAALAGIRARLEADPRAGVGEIGLDRLKTKTVPDAQRALFAAQLALAAERRRPVVLHGAKCWGEVVAACCPHAGRIPAFLFHGFSRSAGLLPQIFALNGFVSVGPALLNDHAVNYRELVKGLPSERLLVETDACCAAGDAAAEEGRARGQQYSILIVQEPGLLRFYEKNGYRSQVVWNALSLSREGLRAGETLRPAEERDIPALGEIYEKAAQNAPHGARSRENWLDNLGIYEKNAVVLEKQGAVKAYCFADPAGASEAAGEDAARLAGLLLPENAPVSTPRPGGAVRLCGSIRPLTESARVRLRDKPVYLDLMYN